MQSIGQGCGGVSPGAVAEAGVAELATAVVNLDAVDSIGIGIGASQTQGVVFA